MFHFYFLLFFFLLKGASCQSETPTLIPKCVDEMAQMLGCVKNETVFQHVFDYNLFDIPFNRALFSEIDNAIICSSGLFCNVSMHFVSYLALQRDIILLYDNKLQDCLTKETYKDIAKTCNRIPRPPPQFYDPCDTEDLDKCVVQEAAKLPNWSEENVRHFKTLLEKLKLKCKCDHKDVPLLKSYIAAVKGSNAPG